MIKTLKISLLLGLLAIVSSGCKDFLNTPPENTLLWEDAMETPEDAQRLLTSTYDVLRAGNFMGGNVWVLSDLMADNMDGRDLSGDWLAYHTHNTGIFITATRDFWYQGYLIIYRANLLIDRIDEVSGLDAGEKSRMIAEAKFVRALCHFELVRFFGQPYGFSTDNSHAGIPLRLEAEPTVIPRSSVADIYAQVIADFEDAIAGLPVSNDGYATSWAAKAYLAKVYFQMNDFQNAYDLADDVNNNGGFSLNPDIMARFGFASNTENIFELVSTGTFNHSGGGLSGAYRSTNLAAAVPGGIISTAMYNIAVLDPNDIRAQTWYVLRDSGQATQQVFLTRFNEDYFNVPLVHLGEMLLLRAESAAELGNSAIAEMDLNAVRVRAGQAALAPGLNAASLIFEARTQRRLEMVGEGVRLHDLKRQAVHDSPNLTINGAPWNCPGMVVQLPDDETAGNPDIELNPQGGCN